MVSPTAHSEPRLWGRRVECETLDQLIRGARAGESAALLVRGEAGVGKTALLDYLLSHASGCRIARAVGVESEMELAFAGLHQLCAPFVSRIERLPEPQRDALETAFGLRSGLPPSRFLVGLAVLSLLSDLADQQPLVCLLDDAQWLDQASAQVLGFVARRLAAEAVVMIFAVRQPTDSPHFAGLPGLTVGPLRDPDARALLASAIPGRLDDHVRDRIIREARGNPLALLELPRAWTPAALAGGYGLPDGVTTAGRVEESFARRLRPLPEDTRRLLLVAAADPTGNPDRIRAAAARLGVSAQAAGPAAAAGLFDAGPQLRFRHPLARSVVYQEATPQDRRLAHAALGAVTDEASDPDRRAWHLAAAAAGPAEVLALELVRSAERAQARGGLAASAAFLGRAADLTPDSAARSERALAAARAAHLARAPAAVERWLGVAMSGRLDSLRRAQAERLRGQIAFTDGHVPDAVPQLLRAASKLEPLDPALARDTYLDALVASQFAGSLGNDSLRMVAGAAQAAPQPPVPRARDLLLDGFVVSVLEGRAAAAPLLRRAVATFRDEDPARTGGFRWMWLAAAAALELWDHQSWAILTTRWYELARDAGAVSTLPLALTSCIFVRVLDGDFATAESLLAELRAVTDAVGSHHPSYGALVLAAWRGAEPAAVDLREAVLAAALPRGQGVAIPTTNWAMAVLRNSQGRYEDALGVARLATDRPIRLKLSGEWALPELIEAAVRCGSRDEATAALDRLSETARLGGNDWGIGLEARCRALVTEGEAAEPLYLEAIARLGEPGLRADLGRAHLLYGEWLRRQNRRGNARNELRAAYELFGAMGAHGFAERARRELIATGETVRKRSVDPLDDLTAQEVQIARLAVSGRTNSEVAAQLFLSPRTVEWHLGKVFAKLGVSSRKELRTALPDESHRRGKD